MYICICNAIRESDLRRAACANNGDVEAVYACMGKRPNCGQCLEDAQAIVDEEREMALMPAYAE
ncbi:(2Fe-2S)-binding protein [Pontixanthobacter aestiaquae]|uniref:Bacterioferritin-associated ferredoxin n=1 Tax=Pontixanthobacter aestiaquae TaxID=1509367 RepID=A0A844Z6I1_9SPHN|nr:(2Fe-2S)-binding protein [Pontixanthobacter aestiaquae]MDN3646152.1 (2Fe-2S)-binding protein [Pontixanthobacter aestiaquae]MXO82856.1 ferredoxin [Pontixanthobacter aestiaquae]